MYQYSPIKSQQILNIREGIFVEKQQKYWLLERLLGCIFQAFQLNNPGSCRKRQTVRQNPAGFLTGLLRQAETAWLSLWIRHIPEQQENMKPVVPKQQLQYRRGAVAVLYMGQKGGAHVLPSLMCWKRVIFSVNTLIEQGIKARLLFRTFIAPWVYDNYTFYLV